MRARNIRPLGREEVLDVLITRYIKKNPSRGITDNLWNYRMWDPSVKPPYMQLFSQRDLDLFPGDRARVVGTSVDQPYEHLAYLIIEGVREKEFALRPGQTVYMYGSKRGKAQGTTFASAVGTSVNGKGVSLEVPVLAFGRVVENPKEAPRVHVTRINLPKDGKGYFLYANSEN